MSSMPADWKTRRSPERPNVLPLALRSPGRDVSIAFAAASQLLTSAAAVGERQIEVDERRVLERFQINAEIGMQCQLGRTISIYTSRDVPDPVEAALSHVNTILPKGIAFVTVAHESAWHSRWEDADVKVEGDTFLQQALRFAAYHLISAANPEDERISIGARALTGESYKGHVFWDTELYMLPFYTFTHPPSARALSPTAITCLTRHERRRAEQVSMAPCTRGNRPIPARKQHRGKSSHRAEKSSGFRMAK